MSLREIQKTMCPESTGPISVRELADEHLWGNGATNAGISVRGFYDRHFHARTRKDRFLFQNTFLLAAATLTIRTPGAPVPDIPIALGNKPALFPRAREIGQVIEDEYDVAAMCEAFSDQVRREILKAWGNSPPTTQAVGPAGTSTQPPNALGSGLFTVATSMTRDRVETHIFTERGDGMVDLDVYSNKGVLMTELNPGLGRGNIEIYSTHMLSGGDIPGMVPAHLRPFIDFDEPGIPARLRIDRQQQVVELADFYQQQHRDENVAIFVGDFNIKRIDSKFDDNDQPYDDMAQVLRQLGFVDLWAERRPATAGRTANFNNLRGDICAVPSGGGMYCEEPELSESEIANSPGDTLDYIFVQRPQATHRISVDFVKPRRRGDRRRRSAPKFDKIEVLSDHLGLDTTLIIAPRH